MMSQLTIAPDIMLPTAYRDMLNLITERLPAIERDTANFNKGHSQLMFATVDCTALTPIRSIKHVLAEIKRTRQALADAEIKRRRNQIDRDEATLRINRDEQRALVDIAECDVTASALQDSMEGAIRKLAYLTTQYEALLDHIGKDHITEADYEREEARYHVLTCLKQALCAARSRGGVIDEGNNIYLFDMGLPAALVQRHVLDYLKSENAMIENGQAPTHAMTLEWLHKVADEIEPFVSENITRRGMVPTDPTALIGATE